MHTKPLFVVAALATLSASMALSPMAAAQSAPVQDTAPSTAPDPMAQPAQPGSQPTAPAAATAAMPATVADLKPTSTVYDAAGAKVGTIESVTSTGAVLSTGTARAEIPVASFAKNAQGLVIGMTKSQFEAAVAKATPAKS